MPHQMQCVDCCQFVDLIEHKKENPDHRLFAIDVPLPPKFTVMSKRNRKRKRKRKLLVSK